MLTPAGSRIAEVRVYRHLPHLYQILPTWEGVGVGLRSLRFASLFRFRRMTSFLHPMLPIVFRFRLFSAKQAENGKVHARW